MTSVECDSLGGTVELGTPEFWGSVVVVEDGGRSWAGSRAGGTGLEGLVSAAEVVVEAEMAAPGGGGCGEGPGTVPVAAGFFF